MKPPCSILIPNYNGREILSECLPSVVEAVRRRGCIDEIIVIDNGSSDDSQDFIRAKFPDVKILPLPENRAIFAVNDGARIAANEIIILLNNDMIVAPDFIDPLLEHFADEAVFAATGKVYQWDRATIQGCRRRAAFAHGFFYYINDLDDTDTAGLTLHALGGQSAYHRAKFLELGGFDTLFSPFYHEDLDISYRACKRGWKIIYEPRSIMYHRGAATAGKIYSRRELDVFLQKNLFLFIWKNIHDPSLWAEHWCLALLRLAFTAVRGDLSHSAGFFRALRQFRAAMQHRAEAKAQARLSDREVLRLLK
ncbi:MAG: glycosyltransferase [bacterium]